MAETQIQKATPQTVAPPEANTLGGFLRARAKHLADLLPKSSALTADKFIKLALLAARRNSSLDKCTMDSVFTCLLQCAELGLDPSGGTAGEAYLIPFKETCTLVIGYRGYIALSRRSGMLKQIETHVVNEKDKFTLKYGLNPTLEHEPCMTGDPGKPVFVYCVARLGDGAVHVEAMTVAQINKIRDASSGVKSGRPTPWHEHWDEMARKTVLRRTAKYIPISAEVQRAIEVDDEQESVVRSEDVRGSLVRVQSAKSDAIDAAIEEDSPAPEPEPVEAPAPPPDGAPDPIDVLFSEMAMVDVAAEIDALALKGSVLMPKGHPRRNEFGKAINDAKRRVKQ